MKKLMLGNEAYARGAYEAGVKVAVGYPGTPSTEILENIVQYEGIKAQWSPNEKVALEVGIGASFGGARALVTMKHVGLNVAADPLFTVSYTGVNGGLVLLVADDPGMHSSQNEQDTRNYGKFAKVPVLEPSDSQEAKDLFKVAFDLSEEFDTPVIVRSSTRISHSQTLVEESEPLTVTVKPYNKDAKKYVMIPAYARGRHLVVEDRLARLREYAESTPLNEIQWGSRKVGIITSGIAYQYVKEAFPEASILKLGMVYPLPERKIREFAEGVENLVIVEELEPFIEEFLRNIGLHAHGKNIFPRTGELTAQMIKNGISQKLNIPVEMVDHAEVNREVPVRPPIMCPGCPHRAVFSVIRDMKLIVSGDIGCYTLGSLPPLAAMDFCVCMGASVGMALGLEKANDDFKGRTVGVIGDSTFFHSGITGLIDMVYNKGTGTILILDNSTTAMTGHQDHPSTGKTLQGEISDIIDIAGLVKACGVNRVRVLDPFDLEGIKNALKEELPVEETSVIILKRPCVLITKNNEPQYQVKEDVCSFCQLCLRVGCPAVVKGEDKVSINLALCTGCGLCSKVCKLEAIVKVGGVHE